ncbi:MULTISPECIES: hypothetical protein [Streptomyces]|uniref:Uncharacterized protein n=1 Tax=Streptomyces flavochromogenes TaxID=68199 RepID=A0ABW6Y3M0_9ACTN
MTRALLPRLERLERRRAEAAALGAEILALLDEWERDDPEELAAFLDSPELARALTPTHERTARR